jgi:MFS family permease
MHEGEKINISDIKNFSFLYWLVNCSMIIMYGVYVIFNNNTQIILSDKYGITGTVSGFIYTIPLFIGLPLLPILGRIVDKIGRRAECNVLSGIIGIVSLLLLFLIPCHDKVNNFFGTNFNFNSHIALQSIRLYISTFS